MSHARTQIRAAFAAVLEAVPGFAQRVVADQSDIVAADDGPWIELVIGSEAVIGKTLGSMAGGRRMPRQFEAYVDIHDRGKSEAVERSEDNAALVQSSIYQSRMLGGLLLSPLTLQSMQPFEPDRTGSLPRHRLRLTFTATYSTTEADATVALSP